MNSFLSHLQNIKNEAEATFAGVSCKEELENTRIKFFGKNGILQSATEIFKSITKKEKESIGSALNDIKKECLDIYQKNKKRLFIALSSFKENIAFDPAINNHISKTGVLHPYSIAIERIENFFTSMGFHYKEGPVLESEFYNFTALNIPEYHPARSDMDTFYVNIPGMLLRTHTSAVQVREAQNLTPPFGIISAGAVYRNEATDASHDFMFYQLECLYLAKDVCIGNMLDVIKQFLQFFFEKEKLDIRVRPAPFPFVEPGLEVDFQCPFCSNGCSVCKQSKWIEICGCGMVHPTVIKHMKKNHKHIRGFAFGFGLTRLVMLKLKIQDIRSLHSIHHTINKLGKQP